MSVWFLMSATIIVVALVTKMAWLYWRLAIQGYVRDSTWVTPTCELVMGLGSASLLAWALTFLWMYLL